MGEAICVGGLNLGGGIEPIPDAAALIKLAAEKGASSILTPKSTRRDALNVSDEIAVKVEVRLDADVHEAFIKANAD